MACQSGSQHRQERRDIALAHVADTGRNPDKNGVKQGNSYCHTNAGAEYYQKRHHQYWAACSGQSTDQTRNKPQKQGGDKMLLQSKALLLCPGGPGSRLFLRLSSFSVLSQQNGNTGQQHHHIQKYLDLLFRDNQIQLYAQNRYVRCIGTGSQNLMAIIMIGAVFNLLNSIQIDPYQSFIQATGIAAFLNAVYNACMNFMGVFMVFSVGYAGAKIFGHDEMAFNNGLMSLMSYLIMVPVATNEVGSTVVVLDYLGSHGVFLAFILGIMATKINIALVERNITIKMPAGVPENVTQCFTSIIPGAAIALVSSLLRGLFTLTPWGNVIDAVYALLQTPLANITGSLGGFIILLLLAQILWFFGVHGSYTVLAILYPLWFTYLPENTAAAAAGLPIPHMWNTSMYDFACNGGCGCTLGLVIVMFLFAKSKRYKEFSKIVLPCGIFNINEPLVYGMPLMLNFTMLIPFIVTPILSLVFAWAAITLGLMPCPTGLIGMNTMPIFIYGVIQGSWKIGIYQILMTIMSAAIWYPFFKAADNQAVAEEKAGAVAEQSEE